jgi:hypothetical protein
VGYKRCRPAALPDVDKVSQVSISYLVGVVCVRFGGRLISSMTHTYEGPNAWTQAFHRP